MSRTKSILVAITFGLMAFLFFRVKVENVKLELLAEYGEETTVVVAKRDILPGVEIDKEDIASRLVPSVFVEPGVLGSIDEVIGQMAQIPIKSGEQILQTKLVFAEGGYLSLKIGKDPARRAITLKLDAEGSMAGLLHPGDHVDVIGHDRTGIARVLARGDDVGKARGDHLPVCHGDRQQRMFQNRPRSVVEYMDLPSGGLDPLATVVEFAEMRQDVLAYAT